MYRRQALALLVERLSWNPAVLLVGPRQVGKTTLARALAAAQPGTVFLDLERAADRARLAEPELFFARHRRQLVVLDEVQLMPGLFAHLRPEIDADRRPGRFLLLGSAAGNLLHQQAESLAGRVSALELWPLLAAEVITPERGAAHDLALVQQLWLRGGFPLSLDAATDAQSHTWRPDFIQTLLQRDLRTWGVNVPADSLHRFWRMLAHLQGQLFNASQLGQSLGGAAHTTVARYLGTLVDALVVRRLEPLLPNVGKRLVKSPKVYVRDSGMVHALLGLAHADALQGHPVAGASWEGFVIEQVAALMPPDATLSFYRTAAGTEIDAVVERGAHRIGIEAKFSSTPKPTKGFWQAIEDLGLVQAYVVAPVAAPYPLAANVEVIPVTQLTQSLLGG
jgi:predicted AAA+ superfamily ATPase